MTVLGIVGTGLIGGSVALAARKYKTVNKIVGLDSDKSTIERAISLGIIDNAIDDLSDLSGADLVCVAVPTHSVSDCVLAANRATGASVPIFDVGSVKTSILKKMHTVPRNFIPCHPIAGSERQGPEASSPFLFDTSPLVITPVAGTDNHMKEKVRAFWEGLGARVYEQKPEEHDRDMALISHLPHMVAFALMEMLDDSPEYLKDRIGGSFKDMVRVAGADSTIWSNILTDNSVLISETMDQFKLLLDRLSTMSKGDPQLLSQRLEAIKAARLELPLKLESLD